MKILPLNKNQKRNGNQGKTPKRRYKDKRRNNHQAVPIINAARIAAFAFYQPSPERTPDVNEELITGIEKQGNYN